MTADQVIQLAGIVAMIVTQVTTSRAVKTENHADNERLRAEMLGALQNKIGSKEYGEKNTVLHGQLNKQEVEIAMQKRDIVVAEQKIATLQAQISVLLEAKK